VVRCVMAFAALAVSETLRAISAVAAPCCSTAAAVDAAIAFISLSVTSIRANNPRNVRERPPPARDGHMTSDPTLVAASLAGTDETPFWYA
jgi:hypothetical protein